MNLKIELLSPLHLGNGRGDAVVDAEIVHDELGIPYFPAKRVRGLLYESALEVMEMLQQAIPAAVDLHRLNVLFGKEEGLVELYVHNLTLPEYEELYQQLGSLLADNNYKDLVSSQDILNSFTSLRYQTRIDENGVAAKSSLHNMRVLDQNLTFVGNIEILNGDINYEDILVLAAANLRYAGAKRNRGFGKIRCSFEGKDPKMAWERITGGK